MKKTGTILDKIVADKRNLWPRRRSRSPKPQLEKELDGLDTSEEPGFY